MASLLTPLVRRAANKRGLLDHVIGTRKIHGRPIPRLGGIAIIAGFYAPLLGIAWFETGVGHLFYSERKSAIALLAGGLVIGLLGLFDDLKGARARQKLAVQGALACALWLAGFRIDDIVTPWGTIPLGPAGLPFTVLWIVGVINALNLIDGLDGLAGGVALFAIGTTFVIAFTRQDPLMVMFMASLGGAVLGFLFYNFNPASIFMGDTGSMFLGYILAVSSIKTSQKTSTAVAILVPIIALGLPIADTLLAVGRRAYRGRPLFSADKEHIHHRLLALGLTQRQTALLLYAICVVLAAGALLLTFARGPHAALILVVLTVAGFLGMRRIGYFQLSAHARAVEQRRRNQQLRSQVRQIRGPIQRAGTAEEIWQPMPAIGLALSCCSLSLNLARAEAEAETQTGVDRLFTWSAATESSGADACGEAAGRLETTFVLRDSGASVGVLTLTWEDGRNEVSRDDEILLELLCEDIAEAWARIRRAAEQFDQPRKLKLLKP